MKNTKMNGREGGKREVKSKKGGSKKGEEGEREGREKENVVFCNGPDTLHAVFNWIKNIQD